MDEWPRKRRATSTISIKAVDTRIHSTFSEPPEIGRRGRVDDQGLAREVSEAPNFPRFGLVPGRDTGSGLTKHTDGPNNG